MTNLWIDSNICDLLIRYQFYDKMFYIEFDIKNQENECWILRNDISRMLETFFLIKKKLRVHINYD